MAGYTAPKQVISPRRKATSELDCDPAGPKMEPVGAVRRSLGPVRIGLKSGTRPAQPPHSLGSCSQQRAGRAHSPSYHQQIVKDHLTPSLGRIPLGRLQPQHVVDEAATVPDELYYAIRPMLAVSRGKLVVMSTPAGRRGWFFQAYENEPSWLKIRIPASFLEEELLVART